MDTPASSATSRSPGGRRRREDAGVMPPSSHPPPSPTHSASRRGLLVRGGATSCLTARSEEHTSELQSRGHLVCRLLLEKKKIRKYNVIGQLTYCILPCL